MDALLSQGRLFKTLSNVRLPLIVERFPLLRPAYSFVLSDSEDFSPALQRQVIRR